jgi:hypothetical protein
MVNHCGGIAETGSRQVHSPLAVNDAMGSRRELLSELVPEVKLVTKGKTIT